jgi:two-component system sensor histidine kinase KdpD
MEDKLSDEEKRELIEYVNKDANWLLNMVENLLTVTRIDNDSAKVNKELEVVDEVAASAVIQFRKRFPKAEIHVKVADEDAMVMMDAMLIQQVILNILQNAQLHAQSEKPLELYIEETADDVIFRIRDYGVGIDENRLKTIFDGGGYRSEKSNTDGYKGMGIGLSICKTIVLAHDGKITAKNHPEGAEFIFSLPKETRD